MDVRCERCKTEYEFDDARITEAGVTVKCTTCGHVFKVKKKALVVTVPVRPDDADSANASPLGMGGGSGEKQREWKVRQASGNVFTFRELTTLQKWIVERKVTREDEISLTGETWKRLGNIAELSSFFQVVDDAQKGVQLTALHNLGMSAQTGSAMATPSQTQAVAAQPPTTQPSFPVVVPPTSAPSGAQVTHFPAAAKAAEPPAAAAPTAPEPLTPATPSAPAAVAEPPASAAPPASHAVRSAARADVAPKKRGLGLPLALLLLLALAGGGYWAYTQGHLPMVDELLGRSTSTEQPTPLATAPVAEVDAGVAGDAPADAGAELAAPVEDAGTSALAAAEVDAGTAAPVDAGVPAVVQKPEPVRDFDYYMAQGDRLRERERAEAAMDAYGKAVDLQPTRAEPYAGRGLALLDMGATLQAEAAFQQALKLNPRYGVAVMGLAEAYRAQGKKDQAVQYYRRYLEILPNGPEAPVARGAIERLGN